MGWGPLARVAPGLLCVACTVAQPFDERSRSIVGQRSTSDDASVIIMSLTFDGYAYYQWCTGTVIRPSIVLTAAHCVDPSVLQGWELAVVDIPVVEAVSDPEYTDYLGGHDLAVLHLAYPVTDIEPKPLTRTRMTKAAVGQVDHFVGYGETRPDVPVAVAVRYEARSPVTWVGPMNFGWNAGARSYTCYGDSGGPHLMMDEGREVLVGVTSYGGAHCTDLEGVQRVDAGLDFIHDFIAEHDPEPAEHCGADGVCGPRSCAAIDPDCPCADDGLCTTACPDPDRDLDCPIGCAADGSCVRDGCPARDPDCGEKPTGEACTANVECASAVCVAADDGRICVPRCGVNRECPSGLSCGYPSNVCLPVDSGGCAIAGDGSGRPALVFWVLVGSILARRGRRRSV